MTRTLAIRWINDACYEIRLSNGKEILVDPYIDESPNKTLSCEDINGADYILISHTHFDHTLSLGAISEKFDSQIFVGKAAAPALIEAFQIPGYRMNPCVPGDVYELDDFKLEIIRGKHTILGAIDTPKRWVETDRQYNLDSRFHDMNVNGSYEYTNYLLTLPNNMRLLIWGGIPDHDNTVRMRQLHPNISIVQFTGNKNNPLSSVGDFCVALGGSLIFPHHHDRLAREMDEGSTELLSVVEDIERRAPLTRVVLPNKGVWNYVTLDCTTE